MINGCIHELTLWHATPSVNVIEIQRKGLIVKDPKFSIHITGSQPKLELVSGEGIYLSANFSLADFIGHLFEVDEVTVFQVVKDTLVLFPGPDGWGTFTVYENIEPEFLVLDHVLNIRRS